MLLYYIQTGNISTSLYAKTHRQAAIKILLENKRINFGICTIVSEEKIEDSSNNVYFLTESILEECDALKLVG